MARGALTWCRQVEQNLLAVYFMPTLMTSGAFHQFVRSLQREGGLLMVEPRRLPFARTVALVASRVRAISGELVPMRVFMTALALFRCGLEGNVSHVGFKVRWLVAIHAADCPVRAEKVEAGLIVIEAREVFPFFH
jgi:hypothetical protein